MLREDQRERLRALGEAQLAIAEKWEQERAERDKLIDQLGEAEKAGDTAKMMELIRQMRGPSRCEHDRSIWSPCAGCEEIEQALNPEFYDENGDRLDDEAIEALVNADPDKYGIPRD